MQRGEYLGQVHRPILTEEFKLIKRTPIWTLPNSSHKKMAVKKKKKKMAVFNSNLQMEI